MASMQVIRNLRLPQEIPMTNAYCAQPSIPARTTLSAEARDRIAAVVASVGIILLLPGAALLMSVLG